MMKITGDDPSVTLHSLFPTLLYQATLAEKAVFRPAFRSVLDEYSFEPKVRGESRYSAGEYHGQILLHQAAPLRPFFHELARHVGTYLQVLGMRSELFEIQCLKSWFVLSDPDSNEDDAMVAHNHSCSDISWVYYLDVPDEAGAVKFHGANPPPTAMFESAFHYDWHNEDKSAIRTVNWWNSDTWSVHPVPGDLLIFPGRQVHSVETNHSQQRRITVAGDLALTLRAEHKNLEFGRTSPEHWLSLPIDRKDAE